MLTGLILKDDDTIARVIPNILKIDGNSIIHGTGKLGGVNFDKLKLIVTDSEQEFKVGDTLPEGLTDLTDTIKVRPVDDLVNSLGQEITKLKFEIMALKGGA